VIGNVAFSRSKPDVTLALFLGDLIKQLVLPSLLACSNILVFVTQLASDTVSDLRIGEVVKTTLVFGSFRDLLEMHLVILVAAFLEHLDPLAVVLAFNFLLGPIHLLDSHLEQNLLPSLLIPKLVARITFDSRGTRSPGYCRNKTGR